MFTPSADYYDLIYAALDKDYAAEARRLRAFISRYQAGKARSLLDVACGTGMHAAALAKFYDVEGMDLDRRMLRIARRKHPGIGFRQGDMADFSFRKQFDVVTCLFSSIGYARTAPRLRRAIRNMASHLAPGGVLFVEPWFSAGQWRDGSVRVTTLTHHGETIVRMSHAGRRGSLSILTMNYLAGSAHGIRHMQETHTMGLFTKRQYQQAFRAAGLTTQFDKRGLSGRGLFIGSKAR